MSFRQESVRVLVLEIVLAVHEEEFVEELVRCLQDQLGVFLHEVREVEHVLVELEDRQLLVGVQLLTQRIAQHQGGSPFNGHQRRCARQDVGRIVGVGHVGDHYPAQLSADLFTSIKGQPLAIGGELAGPDQRGGEVCACDGHSLAHVALGQRLHPEVHGEVHHGAHQRQPEDRRSDLPTGHPGGLRYHNLGILVDPVQRPDRPHEDRQRRQQRNHLRGAEKHDVEISQGRLAVFKDHVGAREALCEQGHHDEPTHDDDHRLEDLPEEMRLDFRHVRWGATLCWMKIRTSGAAFSLANELRLARRCLVSAANGVSTHEDYFRRKRQS